MRYLPERVRSSNMCDFISVPEMSYPVLPEEVGVTNNNAEMVCTICSENNLLVINNLKTGDKHFLSNKTYKKRTNWVSELDTCIASVTLVKHVKYSKVLQQHSLPSGHAPIAVTMSPVGTDLESVAVRAESLGNYSVHCRSTSKPKLNKRPITYENIDNDMFRDNLPQ